jgi:hypothetical protein
MMDYSPVSIRSADRSRPRRWAVVLGLVTVTGFLGVAGLISLPSRAAASEAPIGPGTAATYTAPRGQAVTNTGTNILSDNVNVSPRTTIIVFPPGISDGATHAGDAAGRATTDTTTTTKHHCGGCHPTTTTTTDTTTTDDTDTTTSTTPTGTDSTTPGTRTSHHAQGIPGGKENNHLSGPNDLAYTGSNPALISLVGIGSLLIILGGLLFVTARTRTHGHKRPPIT